MSWQEKIVERWWGCVIAGVVCFILGLVQRGQFLKLESGETKFLLVDPVTKLIYDVGGTGSVVFVWTLLSLFLIGYGVYLFFQKSR